MNDSFLPENLQRITEQEWIERMERKPDAVFAAIIYTPMCGTCKLAMQMISIVLQTGIQVPVYAVNILDIPQLVKTYQIGSVPCFVIMQGEDLIRKEYAMGSVDQLFKWLKEVQN